MERGDRILIVRQPWLDLILSGEKTLEIRESRMKPGAYFLGCRGHVFGKISIGAAMPLDADGWMERRMEHRVPGPMPYKRTYGLPIERAVRVKTLPFHHPRGAIGVVVCRG